MSLLLCYSAFSKCSAKLTKSLIMSILNGWVTITVAKLQIWKAWDSSKGVIYHILLNSSGFRVLETQHCPSPYEKGSGGLVSSNFLILITS